MTNRNRSGCLFFFQALILLALLPILLAWYLSWPVTRLQTLLATRQARADAIDVQIQNDLQLMTLQGVLTPVRLSNGIQVTVGKRLDILQHERERWLSFSELSLPFSFFEPVGSVLARIGALGGGVGMLLILLLSLTARWAPARLPGNFECARRLLLLLQVGGRICVVGTLLCIVALELTVWDVRESPVTRSSDFSVPALCMLLVYLTLVYARCPFAGWLFAPKKSLAGKALTPVVAPRLWQLVSEICGKTGVAVPANIVVGIEGALFVTVSPVPLAQGTMPFLGNVLYLPLPMLCYLDHRELYALLACELAHLRAGEALLARQIVPVQRRYVQERPGLWWGGHDLAPWEYFMLGCFRRNLALESARYEQSAALHAAGFVSKPVLRSALLRVELLAPHVRAAVVACRSDGDAAHVNILRRIREQIVLHGFKAPAHELFSPGENILHDRLDVLGVSSQEEIGNIMRVREGTLLQDLGLEPLASMPASRSVQHAPPSPLAFPMPTVPVSVHTSAPQGRGQVSRVQPTSLSDEIQALFSVSVRAEFKAQIAVLRQIVLAGRGSFIIWEDRVHGMAALPALTILTGPLGLVALLGASTRWVGALLCVVSLLCLYLDFLVHKNRKRLLLTVNERGIEFRDGSRLAWDAVQNVKVRLVRNGAWNSLLVILSLSPDKHPPRSLHGKPAYRFTLTNKVKLWADKLIEYDGYEAGVMIRQFFYSYQARQLLAKLGQLPEEDSVVGEDYPRSELREQRVEQNRRCYSKG